MVLASKTKTPSIHYKKRHGQHHKITKSYHKTYWPYLPLVAIIGLGIGVNTFWNHSSHGVLGYATDMSASELLADTNAQRSADSESGLNLNTALDNAAQAKANNMVALNYWSHDTPSGQPPWVFITAAGYNYSIAGENLAYGFDTSADVIAGWMASPEHRANILNGQYQDVGFGIANSTDFQNSGPETIVVAEYGAPATASQASTPVNNTVQTSPSSTPAKTSSPTAAPTSLTPTATSTPASTPVATATTTPTPVTSKATPTTPPSTEQPKATPASMPVALNATPVSRLQLISNNTVPMSGFIVTLLAAFCFGIVFVRQGLIWRRVLRKGEKFAIRYHLLDILFVSVGVIGFLVTRSAGFIH